MAEAPFLSLESSKTATFLLGSGPGGGAVSELGRWLLVFSVEKATLGSRGRPSRPCCLGVAEAPFLSLESYKMATFLVGSESNVRQ